MSEPKSVKGNILTTRNHIIKSENTSTYRAKLWQENEPWLRTEVMETKRHFKCETPLFLNISKLVNYSLQQIIEKQFTSLLYSYVFKDKIHTDMLKVKAFCRYTCIADFFGSYTL